jgi:cysteine desulfurase
MTRIYADYAAAAPLRPGALAAMAEALAAGAGNASSAHWAGAEARARLETAREEVAAAIGAHPLEIVFTSGATEANNLALGGVVAAAARPLCVAAPASEHSSVLEPLRALAAAGHAVALLAVSPAGLVDPEVVRAAAPDLLSTALVNAETGVVQDHGALAAAARAGGAVIHLDAAQAATTLPVDVRGLGVDLLTLSSHKVGGPPGAGALWVRRGTALAPLQRGGPQEHGLRAGTENVPALAGFAAALTAAVGAQREEAPRLGRLRDRLRAGLAALEPRARFIDGAAPHLLHVGLPGVVGESLVAGLDLEGIAVAAGSACAAGAAEPSHVLLAMGRSRDEAAAGLRVSFGWASTSADVEALLAVLPGILERVRARRAEAAWPAHAS